MFFRLPQNTHNVLQELHFLISLMKAIFSLYGVSTVLLSFLPALKFPFLKRF